jgi:hypothetical protein
MAQVTIDFVGICTHLVNVDGTGVPHRVVLLAPKEWTVNGKTIPPHQPQLTWESGGVSHTELLNGVRLSIAHASGPIGPYDMWPSIPNVNNFTTEGKDKLKPNADVAFNGTSEMAGVYFDLTSGVFQAGYVPVQGKGSPNLPVGTSVVVTTTDDNPTLLFSDIKTGEVTRSVEVDPDSIVLLRNDGNGVDGNDDFLLHFLVFTPVPADASYPATFASADLPQIPVVPLAVTSPAYFDLSAGCSNSTYP